MKNYYDIIIIGASQVGLDYLKTLKDTDKKCLVSKNLDLVTEEIANTDYIKNEVVFLNFNHGLTILELADHTRLCGVKIVIATETKPNCISEFYFRNEHKIPAKSENIAIFGNSDEAANIAITYAKFAKAVYILSSDGKMKMSPGERLKVANIKNIYWMPLAKDKTVSKTDTGYKIILEQDVIYCTQIFDFPDLIPDTAFVPITLVEKDADGYILVKEDNQTTILSTIYAIGNCAKIKGENIIC